MSDARYAIYYAPAPGTPLWSFGSSVLGYDAATGQLKPPLAPEGFDPADWTAMTAQARRYGFHATLKAPFRLADGASEDDLVAAGHAFARRQRAFELPPMDVKALETFVALTPRADPKGLEKLATACVEAFEPFRAPLSDEELARRSDPRLTGRQLQALQRWGYPFVFEDFRFHMTLTGSLSAELVPAVVEGLSGLYAREVGDASTAVEAVTLYVQETASADFRIVDRFVFGAG